MTKGLTMTDRHITVCVIILLDWQQQQQLNQNNLTRRKHFKILFKWKKFQERNLFDLVMTQRNGSL